MVSWNLLIITTYRQQFNRNSRKVLCNRSECWEFHPYAIVSFCEDHRVFTQSRRVAYCKPSFSGVCARMRRSHTCYRFLLERNSLSQAVYLEFPKVFFFFLKNCFTLTHRIMSPESLKSPSICTVFKIKIRPALSFSTENTFCVVLMVLVLMQLRACSSGHQKFLHIWYGLFLKLCVCCYLQWLHSFWRLAILLQDHS